MIARINLEKHALTAAIEGDTRAHRDALACRARADVEVAIGALAQVEKASADAANFTTWRSGMLADKRGLGKIVHKLTTSNSLTVFQTFYDVAGRAATRPGWAGVARRLDCTLKNLTGITVGCIAANND